MQAVVFLSRKRFWNLWFHIMLGWLRARQISIFCAAHYRNCSTRSWQWRRAVVNSFVAQGQRAWFHQMSNDVKCVSPLSCAWRSGGPQWGVTTGGGQRRRVGDRDAGDAPLSHRLNVSWSTGSRLGNFQLQLISDYRNDYSEGVMLCVFISLF